jgi:hypothetical protein
MRERLGLSEKDWALVFKTALAPQSPRPSWEIQQSCRAEAESGSSRDYILVVGSVFSPSLSSRQRDRDGAVPEMPPYFRGAMPTSIR